MGHGIQFSEHASVSDDDDDDNDDNNNVDNEDRSPAYMELSADGVQRGRSLGYSLVSSSSRS